jgi:hypothetical protein
MKLIEIDVFTDQQAAMVKSGALKLAGREILFEAESASEARLYECIGDKPCVRKYCSDTGDVFLVVSSLESED